MTRHYLNYVFTDFITGVQDKGRAVTGRNVIIESYKNVCVKLWTVYENSVF